VRQADGSLALEGLDAGFLHLILGVPVLLGEDAPEVVRERLFPLPGEDEEAREEWRRLVHPDLFALLASAKEIVIRDLGGIEPFGDGSIPGVWRIPIPEDHIQAWISALNAARLALGAMYDIGEADMESDDFEEPFNERKLAVMQISLLGALQAILIEDQTPPPEAAEG